MIAKQAWIDISIKRCMMLLPLLPWLVALRVLDRTLLPKWPPADALPRALSRPRNVAGWLIASVKVGIVRAVCDSSIELVQTEDVLFLERQGQ